MTEPVRGQVDDSTAVVDLTQHVFDQIVAFFAQSGVELPDRREIVIGSLAVDSEVFGVIFGGTHIGPPGNEQSQPMRGDFPRTAIFDVELWRKVSTGGGGARSRPRPPSATAITHQANVAMVDCWVLQQAAFTCDQMSTGVIANTAPLPPQGGMQGVSLSLSLQVP